jgi:hypothetical protein
MTSIFKSASLFSILGLFYLISFTNLAAQDGSFYCGTGAEVCLTRTPPADTIKAVVLYRTDSPPGPLLE